MRIAPDSLRSWVLCLALAATASRVAADDGKPGRARLQIINGSSQTVDVFWLKGNTERVPNGSILPGKDSVITTTVGHRFAVLGRDDGAEATVTSLVPVQGFRFDPQARDGVPAFYTQRLSADGYPIVASAAVNPYALKEAAHLVGLMLARRPDVRDAMIKSGSRLCVMAWNEFTTGLPEFARLASGSQRESPGLAARDYWYARARGLGGSTSDPFCSCGEENLLGYPGDPYAAECILIHEFAHNIHLRGLVNTDPTFDARLKRTYDDAMNAGLWKGKYASVNHHEYFAEGVQSWFDDNRENDHDHNHVNTRAELLAYDPGLAAICHEVFGDTELRYTKPATRLEGHMAGYDPSKAPTFTWPERLRRARALIRERAKARDDAGQKAAKPEAPSSPRLTLDRLFRDGEFDAEAPRPRWDRKTPVYYTLDAPRSGGGRDLVRRDPATGGREVVVAASDLVPEKGSEPFVVEAFEFSDDGSNVLIYTNGKRVWRRNTRGDYWVFDRPSRRRKKLGGDCEPSTLMFARFSPDGSRVAYVRANNLYVQDLRDMKIIALTTDGSATLVNGTSDWVNEEELNLRDCFRWSPDGRQILFWQFDTSGVPSFHLVNNTEGNYPKIVSFAYPKVGERNSATRLGVVGAGGGEVRWLRVPGDPREHYIPHAEWTPDGSQVLVQQFNRLQNENRVMLADPRTGTTHLVMTESDAAWLENENPVRWVNNGKDLLWLSEHSGWRHGYLAHLDGTPPSPVTRGEFDVINVEAVDAAGGWLYYAASPENATQRYLYRTRLEGGAPERLSPDAQPGWHEYDISPDAKWAVHSYSRFSTPPVVELVRLPDHSVVRVLADNQRLRERLDALKQPSAEFLKVDVGDGITLDGWCLKPPNMDPGQKHPLLIHVYGEPHGQAVKDAWGGPRSLWHWMLAQQGVVVAAVDNRGTNVPRGRDWRKCVHRQIGILAPREQAKAVRALLERWEFVDPTRVGVWGWSGGGSMSLNAIFRYPELYRTAISVAPNADQRLYDTIYQERYMGLPGDNAGGYRDGSPLTHAHRLRGNLLLVHGTGDDNDHYQGTERLINELVARGKYFAVLPYPNRSHALSEGPNTVRHFWGYLTRYLQDNLISAAAPAPEPVAETRTVRGWTLHIHRELLASEPRLTERAVERLDRQLAEIERVVPDAAVAELRKVPLYFNPEYPAKRPSAEFHPDGGWLRSNGRDPAMAGGIEFTNIRVFEQETRRMPNFALHELAHAYHFRVLPGGNQNPKVRAAFEKAKAGGKYDKVERRFGDSRPNTFEKAYAMRNPMEYFAECSEAYFSTNDYFPFTREDLRRHDPEVFERLGELWDPSRPES